MRNVKNKFGAASEAAAAPFDPPTDLGGEINEQKEPNIGLPGKIADRQEWQAGFNLGHSICT